MHGLQCNCAETSCRLVDSGGVGFGECIKTNMFPWSPIPGKSKKKRKRGDAKNKDAKKFRRSKAAMLDDDDRDVDDHNLTRKPYMPVGGDDRDVDDGNLTRKPDIATPVGGTATPLTPASNSGIAEGAQAPTSFSSNMASSAPKPLPPTPPVTQPAVSTSGLKMLVCLEGLPRYSDPKDCH